MMQSSGYLDLAFCLATCPDASFRNAKEAVELAQKGCALETEPGACGYAMAAAYAEAGNFDEAIRCQKQYIEYLNNNKDRTTEKAVVKAKEYLQLYQQHKPYHGVIKMSEWGD